MLDSAPFRCWSMGHAPEIGFDTALLVSAMKLLVVEDDPETSAYLVKGLQEQGHLVDHVAEGRDGLFMALNNTYDVMIIDRMLPALDGLSMVRAARAAGNKTPVLFLSTMSGIDDRVTGLDAGGDDYLVKPFAFTELLSRVKALGRRPRGTSIETYFKVADLELDMLKRVVKRAGREIALQPRE